MTSEAGSYPTAATEFSVVELSIKQVEALACNPPTPMWKLDFWQGSGLCSWNE